MPDRFHSQEIESENKPWYVYMAQCADGSLYTGITQNVGRRIDRHNSGTGALHVRVHGNLTLLWTEMHANLPAARKRETQLKGWTRRKKFALIQGDFDMLKKL